MNIKDKQEYINRYTKEYNKYGYSPLSLCWGQQDKQKLRFKILTEIGIRKSSSILDIGCGFGDLFGYLKGIKWQGKYIGLDIVDCLLNEAKKRYPLIDVRNFDILDQQLDDSLDFVIASGIFNAYLQYEDNYNYIERMLRKMFALAKTGISINFLSSYADFQNEIAFHSDPSVIFSMSKKITKRVLLRHDYMPFEFTIYLLKADNIITPGNIFPEVY